MWYSVPVYLQISCAVGKRGLWHLAHLVKCLFSFEPQEGAQYGSKTRASRFPPAQEPHSDNRPPVINSKRAAGPRHGASWLLKKSSSTSKTGFSELCKQSWAFPSVIVSLGMFILCIVSTGTKQNLCIGSGGRGLSVFPKSLMHRTCL